MRSSFFGGFGPAIALAAVGLTGLACSDDPATPAPSGTGGASATGGSSGAGGAGGTPSGSGGGAGAPADASGDAGCAFAGPLAPPTVPAKIQPPAGAVLGSRYHAAGSQIYVCKAAPAGAAGYTFQFKAPEADLTNASCEIIGKHGAGPFWESTRPTDTSKVQGAKVDESPGQAGAIPLLLLKATQNWGTSGVFSATTFIQRVDTVGGLAPSTGCDAANVDKEVKVPYTADYYFYNGGSATDGGSDAASDAGADGAANDGSPADGG